MAKRKDKAERRLRIRQRIRQTVQGTSVRPRLSVYRSNVHIYAQLIDDIEGHTMAAASSLEGGVAGDNPKEESQAVGELLAERAKEQGIQKVVFDRSGYKYHGRVAALAEGARKGGLQF